MTAVGDGWWPATAPPATTVRRPRVPARLRLRLDGGEPALPDPRSAWQPAGRPRPEPLLRRRRASAGPTTAGAARATAHGVLGGGRLRAARRHLHRRRAPSTPPPSGSTTSSTLGVDVVELMPRRRLPRPVGLGLRRRRPLRGRTTATAARRRCSASSTPATRAASASCLDVVYNHLGPSGQLPVALRPVLHRGAPHAVGRRPSTSTTPGAEHVRRLPRRQRAALVPRLPRRRPAPRRRPRAARTTRRRHSSPSSSDAVAALAAELGRPLDLVAESDLNDTVHGDAHRPRAAAG